MSVSLERKRSVGSEKIDNVHITMMKLLNSLEPHNALQPIQISLLPFGHSLHVAG
jgi:hypothetical protein